MAKILIVDDNPGNRSLLVEILGRSGHTIREASDGGEALAQISHLSSINRAGNAANVCARHELG